MVGLSADLLSAAKVGPWTYVHTVELCPFLLGPEASKANKLELAAVVTLPKLINPAMQFRPLERKKGFVCQMGPNC